MSSIRLMMVLSHNDKLIEQRQHNEAFDASHRIRPIQMTPFSALGSFLPGNISALIPSTLPTRTLTIIQSYWLCNPLMEVRGAINTSWRRASTVSSIKDRLKQYKLTRHSVRIVHAGWCYISVVNNTTHYCPVWYCASTFYCPYIIAKQHVTIRLKHNNLYSNSINKLLILHHPSLKVMFKIIIAIKYLINWQHINTLTDLDKCDLS